MGDKDYLTGLLGTGDYIKECDRIVKEGGRELVFITNDISNFKYVNDLYSMEEGDRFIAEMAHFFYTDNPKCLAACRMNCDQFRGLFDMTGMTHEQEIERVIAMNEEFEKRMSERYPNVFFHVYTGIYFMDGEKLDVRLAMDRAHIAKKKVKGKFDIKCNVYNPEDFKKETEQMSAVNMFLKAVDNDDIQVYLQPKYSVSKKCVVGAEALARLIDGEGKVIMPASFIPVLETTGMIGMLDEIMLEKVFALQRMWLDEGVKLIPISVNISPVMFTKDDFVQMVLDLQRKYNVSPEYIELEVLESTVTDAVESVVRSIEELRAYGFKVSVDDFGSGYSSLNQISSIPADIIKLDRVFARKGLSHEKGRKVVKALIQMLHDVGFSVVFEGIETETECNMAYFYGCDLIQGYFYSKPIPTQEFKKNYFM